ncbi:molybdopterin-guanine dinucleotide biosynthesis protein A/copper chaperone [Hydrogenivirga caldilitoris]|uniref:Molybdopterin-guanine dinucleotide biosynthesis protein A/copper chaperone n=1 Tax=Hydrogenivirga caldilitoris TaxID=246264 RepID=A0A497XSD3_9AQUI|nr:copper ion binding protein [Hydrogenivirga caldilitoris]RLJ69833.1 molybdopterin-guanine dinucleotide biosynthesis protein A/copper chaperone [Hydrogenivirga caldilitoris]
MKELELKVQGMTCEHCVRTVQRAISSLEGVSKVEVFLDSGRVNVYMEKEVPLEDIKKSIEEWGYRVVD